MRSYKRIALAALTSVTLATSAVAVPQLSPAFAQTASQGAYTYQQWRYDLEDAASKLETANEELDAAQRNLKRVKNAHTELTAAQERRAALENQQKGELTTAELSALAGQATMEMINLYRVQNGLHPLRSHPLFTDRASFWNMEMAKLYLDKEGKDADGTPTDHSFRHSTDEELEKGAENILVYSGDLPSTSKNKEDWGKLAVEAFEGWRNSPTHNANMITEWLDGASVAYYADSKRNLWGTTLFHNEEVRHTPNSDGMYFFRPTDGTMVEALERPQDFYMPTGAMEALGITNWSAPTTLGKVPKRDKDGNYVPSGNEEIISEDADPVSYTDIVGGKTEMENRVNKVPLGGTPDVDWGKVKTESGNENANKAIQDLNNRITELTKIAGDSDAVAKAEKQVRDAKTKVATAKQNLANIQHREPRKATPTSTSTKATSTATKATSTPTSTKTTPTSTSTKATPTSTAPKTTSTSTKATPTSTATKVTPTSTKTSPTSTSTKATSTPTPTSTKTAPTPTSEPRGGSRNPDGSLSPGAIIGIVIGVLVLIGAGIVAAAPMLRQFGIRF
ncbi:hypothetical protein [Corynebacterium aquatimens]|uniref:Nucleic acid-binding Zn-ribbon protein n=1 Tax=Corynebacterium aquatimens TaxID=1190508 RepID=A0A931GU80_9CORY|nr:hypothetical protein [Corynebacterium aquatimens]MBG6122505.1 putative nucleic acid-binding Zn-ribbon protein [Corynebacterium aquatimens]WJY64955.1 hypothetical protein CAQUA_01080 [Corynebacterium aquatimens]